jgi:hypothetical protein
LAIDVVSGIRLKGQTQMQNVERLQLRGRGQLELVEQRGRLVRAPWDAPANRLQGIHKPCARARGVTPTRAVQSIALHVVYIFI